MADFKLPKTKRHLRSSVSDTFELHTDASSHDVGSVLNVVQGEDVLPVAFQSRQLCGAE